MRLGIAVVYQALLEDEQLLNIHLKQIERCTDVPYTIHAAANRSSSEIRTLLSERPHVKICNCPTTDLREMWEHSYYLEHLVKAAVDDGATHIAILHMDSFPVRPGWVEYLTGQLGDTCVFGSTDPIATCIMFFHRDFYLRCQPRFLLPAEELETASFKAYMEKHSPEVHSGVGYGYKAFTEGLSWFTIAKTTMSRDVRFGEVFGDLVFHLSSATYWGRKERPAPPLPEGMMRNLSRLHATTRRWAKALIPESLWSHIPWPAKNLRGELAMFEEKSAYEEAKSRFETAKKRLCQDLDQYLGELREGRD